MRRKWRKWLLRSVAPGTKGALGNGDGVTESFESDVVFSGEAIIGAHQAVLEVASTNRNSALGKYRGGDREQS